VTTSWPWFSAATVYTWDTRNKATYGGERSVIGDQTEDGGGGSLGDAAEAQAAQPHAPRRRLLQQGKKTKTKIKTLEDDLRRLLACTFCHLIRNFHQSGTTDRVLL
jgi:hypothetical protein